MGVKQVLRAFWAVLEDYDGDISCRKVKSENGHTWYLVETDGNRFDAVVHDSDPDLVFYRGEGIIGQWRNTDGTPVVELNGIPYVMDELLPDAPTMRPSQIAQAAGVSIATVYRHAKNLGRFPTVEEIRNSKMGRPRKY